MDTIRVLVFLCVTGFSYCEVSSNVGIYGGHQVAIEDAPFMASVRLDRRYHWCGGSIVHKRFVLTAAHCIKPNRTFNIMVGTNIADRTGGESYEIKEYILHRKYNNKTYNFDFCLLKLSTPIELGEKVKVIELADGSSKLSAGTMLNVTGWGGTENDTFSKNLLQVLVPLVDRLLCQIQYMGFGKITSNMLCAGVQGKDTCTGDSGGPLTLGNVQYGVTSFGRGCGSVPGVYAKISVPVQKWIKRTIRQHLIPE